MIRATSNRSRRLRLAQLEVVVQEVYDSGPTGPITAPEWLEYYQECHEALLFHREPDFESTLAEFQQLLETIPVSRHVPTTDFEPDRPERERLRIWHIRHGISELTPLYRELEAMRNRAFKELEGVSKAEFNTRKAWFQANLDDLPMHYMVAEDGRTEPRNNTIETVLYQGPTSRHALNTLITLREWEKGNYDRTTTYGEWKRRRVQAG